MQPFPIHTTTPVTYPGPQPATSDIVVIGGGIIGVCTALFLAREGHSVTLLEKGRIAAEQSSRNWGWIRQQGRDPDEMPIMAEAQALWRDAVRLGVWPTADQRPVTTAIDGVYAAPFHSVGSFPWINAALRRRLPEVLAEAAAVESGAGLHDGARPDRLHRPTASGGSWSEYYFYRAGVREEENCQRCPAICELYAHKLSILNRLRLPSR